MEAGRHNSADRLLSASSARLPHSSARGGRRLTTLQRTPRVAASKIHAQVQETAPYELAPPPLVEDRPQGGFRARLVPCKIPTAITSPRATVEIAAVRGCLPVALDRFSACGLLAMTGAGGGRVARSRPAVRWGFPREFPLHFDADRAEALI